MQPSCRKKLAIREQAANEIIWRSVMTKAIAVALNPVTVLDVLTGAIVDVAMIVTLSRLYGLPMTQAGAIQLLRSIALELGGISASELMVTLGLSSLKGLLGISAPATGGTVARALYVGGDDAGGGGGGGDLRHRSGDEAVFGEWGHLGR